MAFQRIFDIPTSIILAHFKNFRACFLCFTTVAEFLKYGAESAFCNQSFPVLISSEHIQILLVQLPGTGQGGPTTPRGRVRLGFLGDLSLLFFLCRLVLVSLPVPRLCSCHVPVGLPVSSTNLTNSISNCCPNRGKRCEAQDYPTTRQVWHEDKR